MVKIRLMRMGAKKRPFYRVVVADARSPRDGRFIENIGKYHPLSDPSLIEIDEERALHWLGTGAQPSDPVRVLMQKVGIWEKFKPEDQPRQRADKGPRRSKKAAAAAEAPPAAETPPEEPTANAAETPEVETPAEATPVEESAPAAAAVDEAEGAEEPQGS